MHKENAEEIKELYDTHPTFLEGDHLNAYFCEYYHSVVKRLTESQTLSVLIEAFDEAVYFSASLVSIFSLEKEDLDVFMGAIDSQEDFDTWKDYIVLLAISQSEE